MADSLDVTGSVPDVVGLALSLSGAMSASAGFTMNSIVFPVTTPPKPPTTPASAKSTTPSRQSKSSAASSAPPPSYPKLRTAGKPFFAVEEILTHAAFGEMSTLDRIRIGLHVVAVDGLFLCAPVLRSLRGFDTQIGDQIAIEMAYFAREDGSVILTIYGFVNPAGPGFGRFLASVSVAIEGSDVITKPIGEMVVTASTQQIRGSPSNEGHTLYLNA